MKLCGLCVFGRVHSPSSRCKGVFKPNANFFFCITDSYEHSPDFFSLKLKNFNRCEYGKFTCSHHLRRRNSRHLLRICVCFWSFGLNTPQDMWLYCGFLRRLLEKLISLPLVWWISSCVIVERGIFLRLMLEKSLGKKKDTPPNNQNCKMFQELFLNNGSVLGWIFPLRSVGKSEKWYAFAKWQYGNGMGSVLFTQHGIGCAKASMEQRWWLPGNGVITKQQNTSRVEQKTTKQQKTEWSMNSLSVWGIMGHHNLQQNFKGHWNKNWTPHSYCNTVLQWFAVCTLWITNTFNFFLCFVLFFLL